MTNIIVNGAAGKMGTRILASSKNFPNISIIGALESPKSNKLGFDIGTLIGLGETGIKIISNPEEIKVTEKCVLVDFSLPDSTIERLKFCLDKIIPMVIGTTGFSEIQTATIKNASVKIPILLSTNMSYGVNLIFKIIGDIAKALGDDYNIEIVETHHKFKKDAPSGTAKTISELICKALNRNTDTDIIYGRKGITGERSKKTIGVHAIRGGDVVGEHTISFLGPGERIEITHKAHSRDTFAMGALKAAEWIADKKPGLYNMINVLGS